MIVDPADGHALPVHAVPQRGKGTADRQARDVPARRYHAHHRCVSVDQVRDPRVRRFQVAHCHVSVQVDPARADLDGLSRLVDGADHAVFVHLGFDAVRRDLDPGGKLSLRLGRPFDL